MWTVLLVSIGLIPIGFLGLAIYASALIARPISEREHRSSSFSDLALGTAKSGPADVRRGLRGLVSRTSPQVIFCRRFRHACLMGLEGIVSRAAADYAIQVGASGRGAIGFVRAKMCTGRRLSGAVFTADLHS